MAVTSVPVISDKTRAISVCASGSVSLMVAPYLVVAPLANAPPLIGLDHRFYVLADKPQLDHVAIGEAPEHLSRRSVPPVRDGRENRLVPQERCR
jgi:hypothetical protein